MAKARRKLRIRETPVTWALTGICVAAFVGCWVVSGIRADEPFGSFLQGLIGLEDIEVLRWFGALEMTRVWRSGQWWRVGTTGLLHGSALHVGLNMVGLVSLGRWLERAVGGLKFGLLFAVSSIGGCLASLAWAESGVVVGASAGIFGLAGAMILWRTVGPEEWQERLKPISAKRLSFFVGLWLVIGWVWPSLGSGRAILAQAGHVGGLVAGLLMGLALDPRAARAWGGRAGLVAGLLGLVWMGRAPTWKANYHALMGGAALEEERYEEAVEAFDRALEMEPDDSGLKNAVAYSLAEAGVELGRAEALSLETLAEDPDSPDYLDTLGWTYCRQGRIAEGLQKIEQAIEAGGDGFPEIEGHLDECAAATADGYPLR